MAERLPYLATQNAAPYEGIAPIPVAILLDQVRSLYNVGAFFRTADAAGCEKLYLCGITGRPPKPGIAKTALGSEETVPWEHHADAASVIHGLRQRNYEIAAVETSVHAVDLFDWQPRFPVCILFGHEVDGLGAGAAGTVRHLRADSDAGPQTFAERGHRGRRGDLRATAEVSANVGQC